MSIHVRPVRYEELALALPLFAGYQRFYGVDRPVDARNMEFFARFVDPSDAGLLLGGWAGTELVGFACLYWTFSSVNARPIALMNDLFVDPKTRGRGTGRALIDAAAEAARRRGCHYLEWHTAPDNVRAQRLYDSITVSRSSLIAYEIPLNGD